MDWLWRRIAAHVPQSQPFYPPTPASDGSTAEGIFREVAARQLDTQITTNDVFDARNMNIVWIGSTVLPVTFGLLSVGQVEIPPSAEWSLRASVLFYVFLLVTSWWASHYRGLSSRPDLFDLSEFSENYAAPLLEQWVAIEYTRSTDENSRLLNSKARWVGWANTLLYLEGLTLSIAAVLTLL